MDPLRRELDEAGMTFRDDGVLVGLHRLVPPRAWPLPADVMLDGHRLVWLPTELHGVDFELSVLYEREGRGTPEALRRIEAQIETGELRLRQPGEGMLERFVELPAAPDEVIESYARHWGVLELCRHGLPRVHNPAGGGSYPTACKALLYGETGLCWESTAMWRDFSIRARAALLVAARVHREIEPEATDIVALVRGTGLASIEARWHGLSLVTKIRTGAFLVTTLVNKWQRWGAVEPVLYPQANFPFALGGPTLFSNLAIELMLAVGRVDGFFICSGCGKFKAFGPAQYPGEHNWCGDCRDQGKPQQFASRVARRRKARQTAGG